MRRNTSDVIRSNRNLVLIVLTLFLSILLTVPILEKIRSHPDEHQFYFNAFAIMAGKPLHNYLHVALTEYALAGFFSVVNMFTDSGVNFPQGEPSPVTFFYGKVFGFILYILTFILGVIVLQRNEWGVKVRSVIFGVLYFASIGMFERFLRINSDSMSVFVYLNFAILSFVMHRQKASVFRFFLLNTAFLFLGTFTNLKSLFMMSPLLFLNTLCPFVWYENRPKADEKTALPKFYRFVLYLLGIVSGVILLWVLLAPKPFDYIRFWYGVKKTIIHGTQFDFDYPSQSYGSWEVYLYDLIIEQLGLGIVLALGIFVFVSYRAVGKNIFVNLWRAAKGQLRIQFLRDGDLYQMTELILFLGLLIYYLGVSTRVVHWSRWGAPIGFLSLMLISVGVENVIRQVSDHQEKLKVRPVVLVALLFLVAWSLRFALTYDIYTSNHPEMNAHKKTVLDFSKFLKEKGMTPEEAKKKVVWYEGYAVPINSISLDKLVEKENSEAEYLLWSYWHLGHLYARRNVNRGMHNQVAFLNKYAGDIEYRFPNLLSFYAHVTKYFAWKVLGITWNPEIDNLIENQYAIIKLKAPVRSIQLAYEILFKDMSHYHFPYSLTFNMKNLNDSYMWPPCYSFPDAKYAHSGDYVMPPSDFGVGGRTAGLYCHSMRFVYLFKGTYRIRIDGLPKNDDNSQVVYSNMANYDWDPETKTITIDMKETFVPGEFGIATKEKNVKGLKFIVFYSL